MKLTFLALFLCVTGLFATGASSQVAKVTITARSTPFGKILSNIEKQTDYYFVYDKRDIDLNRKVSIDAREKTVEEVLSTIFRNTDIVYAMKSNNIILMKNNDRMLAIMQQANRKTITGVVLDPQGESIIGANVMEKGTSNGTITDIDGSFTLDVAPNATLQVTYIGYMAQEVPVKNQTSVRILMKEDTQNLEEVVVVGYGVQKKANLTGAVSVVSSKDLKDVSSSSVSQALQGKLSGVVITKSNGQPGASSDIRIRGMGTFGDNAPLVVIDGIPADGGLESISSSDIESVNVLKDAASAAIYGSRAANGVILVTTKRGVSEKSSISVDGYFGLQRITRYLDMCNAAEFVELQNEAIANANRWIGGSNITPYFTNDPASYGKGTDWGKELFSVAPTYNVNVSAQGGSQNSSYYMSGGYVDQEGILENTSYNKANFRINNDNKYGERLSFGTSINLSTSLQHGTSNAAGDAYNVSPTIPLYEADGVTPG
ncbi:MAG: SusC/RagA family TonB-linked outer membrane protein, partial [Parabacteroides gordonii]|uniref:SusC/RagA family TonB-linked outer membrane protein n=1 Tax=Parabacteroides gordonii TaxID=574930 RepID=UPI003A858E3F